MVIVQCLSHVENGDCYGKYPTLLKETVNVVDNLRRFPFSRKQRLSFTLSFFESSHKFSITFNIFEYKKQKYHCWKNYYAISHYQFNPILIIKKKRIDFVI